MQHLLVSMINCCAEVLEKRGGRCSKTSNLVALELLIRLTGSSLCRTKERAKNSTENLWMLHKR